MHFFFSISYRYDIFHVQVTWPAAHVCKYKWAIDPWPLPMKMSILHQFLAIPKFTRREAFNCKQPGARYWNICGCTLTAVLIYSDIVSRFWFMRCCRQKISETWRIGKSWRFKTSNLEKMTNVVNSTSSTKVWWIPRVRGALFVTVSTWSLPSWLPRWNSEHADTTSVVPYGSFAWFGWTYPWSDFKLRWSFDWVSRNHSCSAFHCLSESSGFADATSWYHEDLARKSLMWNVSKPRTSIALLW